MKLFKSVKGNYMLEAFSSELLDLQVGDVLKIVDVYSCSALPTKIILELLETEAVKFKKPVDKDTHKD